MDAGHGKMHQALASRKAGAFSSSSTASEASSVAAPTPAVVEEQPRSQLAQR